MKIRYILFFLFVGLITTDSNAQENELFKKTDTLFLDWDKPDVPGCALAVIKDGQVVYKRGYGMADLEHDVPITPETVFYIGSTSKQFVAFCILLLREEGKLKLDDDIRNYLPDFPEYEAPITIRNLIHHTSGIRDYLNLFMHAGRSYLDHIPREEVYDMICRQKELNFEPGSEYLYSNSCYFLLWQIIEEVSGQSLKEFAEEQIFGPLGMKNSHFHDDNTHIIKDRAFCYFLKDTTSYGTLILRFDLVGSGGLFTSVEDLFLWDQNFYDNKLGMGGQDIIERMHINGILNNGNEIDYAFALVKGKYRGARTVSHGGSLAGYRTQLLRFPEHNFSVIILANVSSISPGALAYNVADLYLDDVLESGKSTSEKMDISSDKGGIDIDPAIFDKYIGSYEIAPNYIAAIFRKEGKMMLQVTGQPELQIFPESEKRFFLKVVKADLEFGFNEDGTVKGMVLFQNGQIIPARRLEDETLTEDELLEFTGDYFSEELLVNYNVYLENGTLHIRVAYTAPINLNYSRKDVFEGGFTFKFQRDKNGTVSGLIMDAGRVRHLYFSRASVPRGLELKKEAASR